MHRSKGMVLVTTLLVLCLIELIVLSQMQLIIVQIKSLNQLVWRHQRLQLLEQTAHHLLGSKLAQNTACIIAENPIGVIAMLRMQQGCFAEKAARGYQYIIENLGELDCVEWVEEGAHFATHHWRLTIEDLSMNTILQIRKAEKTRKSDCKTASRVIKHSLLSWNYLTREI